MRHKIKILKSIIMILYGFFFSKLLFSLDEDDLNKYVIESVSENKIGFLALKTLITK